MFAGAKGRDWLCAAVLACVIAAIGWAGARDEMSLLSPLTGFTINLPALSVIFFMATLLPGEGHVTMGGEIPLGPLVGLTWLFWFFLFGWLVVRRRKKTSHK